MKADGTAVLRDQFVLVPTHRSREQCHLDIGCHSAVSVRCDLLDNLRDQDRILEPFFSESFWLVSDCSMILVFRLFSANLEPLLAVCIFSLLIF